MHGMIKIIKAIEDSAILIKGTMKTIETEIKEQKIGFLGMLLGTLGACLLGNISAGQGIVRAGYHPLTSFEAQRRYTFVDISTSVFRNQCFHQI